MILLGGHLGIFFAPHNAFLSLFLWKPKVLFFRVSLQYTDMANPTAFATWYMFKCHLVLYMDQSGSFILA